MAEWLGYETCCSLLIFWPVFLSSHLPLPGQSYRESLTEGLFPFWLATHLRQNGVGFGARWVLDTRPSLGG